MTKTAIILILCVLLGIAVWLLIPRWDAHAEAELYRTQAEQAMIERDQALAIADSMAEMSAAKAIHIHQMQQRLDAFIAASNSRKDHFIPNAIHDLDRGGLDSAKSALVRDPRAE